VTGEPVRVESVTLADLVAEEPIPEHADAWDELAGRELTTAEFLELADGGTW
jgi:hypothetical protein